MRRKKTPSLGYGTTTTLNSLHESFDSDCTWFDFSGDIILETLFVRFRPAGQSVRVKGGRIRLINDDHSVSGDGAVSGEKLKAHSKFVLMYSLGNSHAAQW